MKWHKVIKLTYSKFSKMNNHIIRFYRNVNHKFFNLWIGHLKPIPQVVKTCRMNGSTWTKDESKGSYACHFVVAFAIKKLNEMRFNRTVLVHFNLIIAFKRVIPFVAHARIKTTSFFFVREIHKQVRSMLLVSVGYSSFSIVLNMVLLSWQNISLKVYLFFNKHLQSKSNLLCRLISTSLNFEF